MTAPHDTQRRGDERRWAPRPIFACDECGFASTMDYRHCPFEPHHDLERPPTAYKPLREMVVEEVAPVQSEGEHEALLNVERAAHMVAAHFDGEYGAWKFAGRKLPDTDDTGHSEAALALLSLVGYLNDVAYHRSPPTTQEARTDG